MRGIGRRRAVMRLGKGQGFGWGAALALFFLRSRDKDTCSGAVLAATQADGCGAGDGIVWVEDDGVCTGCWQNRAVVG